VPDRPHAFEVTLSGEVDSETSAMLDAELDAVIGADARFVVLDLSAVTFLDSSGLRSIVRARNALAERDGRLTCAGLSAAAAKVLEISGLLEHLRDRAPGP
jgi:anti-anti-sigma factor